VAEIKSLLLQKSVLSLLSYIEGRL
jgi:hypothetical protein